VRDRALRDERLRAVCLIANEREKGNSPIHGVIMRYFGVRAGPAFSVRRRGRQEIGREEDAEGDEHGDAGNGEGEGLPLPRPEDETRSRQELVDIIE
jgi:hypothetical protein